MNHNTFATVMLTVLVVVSFLQALQLSDVSNQITAAAVVEPIQYPIYHDPYQSPYENYQKLTQTQNGYYQNYEELYRW